MEGMFIDFSGYIDIAKNDLIIEEINDETGKLESVNVHELTRDEIIEGVKSGQYYINFIKCYQNAHDGRENFTIGKDE